MSNYVRILLDSKELDYDVSDLDFPISFDYQLEDVADFQKKKSSESIGFKIPATPKNQKELNTLHNTAYSDNTSNQYFKGIRDFVAEVNGLEIFVGKAFPKRGVKRGGVPVSFELNVFGNNADWIIPLKEVTLYDILKRIDFQFTKTNIINSWQFNGRDESMPYVFAPVKYGNWLDPKAGNDKNYAIETMKPSISLYWILYWGFQSVGYRIESHFFDTDWGRKMVLPWTFGSFLSSGGTKYEIHKFLAKSSKEIRFNAYNGIVDLDVRDDVDEGTFDNNNTVPNPPGDYEYIQINKEMKWTYNTPHYGTLEASFEMSLFYDYKLDLSSDVWIDVYFYKNGIHVHTHHVRDDEAPTFGATSGADLAILWFDTTVQPGDVISAKVYLRVFKSKTATVARCHLKVEEYKLAYFRIPIGGKISFDSYLTLQKEKFLEFLKGVVDTANLSIQTDPVMRVVLIEPTHPYSLNKDKNKKEGGYFDNSVINWSEKEDISKDSIVDIYDDNARQFTFKFKDDGNDGALKVVQDRFKITLASGKYIFQERFKSEKKEFQNRYFSPTMHYLVSDFSLITGQPPQMICLVPENISNTSSSESENTFTPKLAYYKGLVTNVGGWIFDGKTYKDYPYMFAVNYKPGGENDPILSYSDEKIGDDDNYVIGTGLLKRFFLQRLVIMNNGQWYISNFNLNNHDITNWYHRERIDVDGGLFELIKIKSYSPLKSESNECVMRKWVPISEKEFHNIYPSASSVLTDAVEVYGDGDEPPSEANAMDKVFDTQYNRLMCLYNDIPKPNND